MADQNKANTTEKQGLPTVGASTGEEVRTPSVTAGTNGGTSNRSDYEPEKKEIAPEEPGGTKSHAA